MTIPERLSLMWRRFSPLEERLIAAVREVLPPQAQSIFDVQIAGVTLVQRLPPHWLEISFYRRKRGKVDWSGIATFPRTGEFRLAEVQSLAHEIDHYVVVIGLMGGGKTQAWEVVSLGQHCPATLRKQFTNAEPGASGNSRPPRSCPAL